MKKISNIKVNGKSLTIRKLASEDAKKAWQLADEILPANCVYRHDNLIHTRAVERVINLMQKFNTVSTENVCHKCKSIKICPFKKSG